MKLKYYFRFVCLLILVFFTSSTLVKAQSAQSQQKSPSFYEHFTYDAAWMYAPPKIVQPITLVAPPIDMPLDNTLLDQVFDDDVIVRGGSLCVGLDCNTGENFGFDTGRFKENNLRLHFDDTSSSASFPSNDWRIVINDSSNGGGNYFAVEDATASRVPFRIEAGAPVNSLYVEADGDVGFGTNNPVVRAHAADGDTPTLRLEQTGSSGFTPQTWDVAANETNFFIRDATNGSTLPFRIRPGAPESSIDIASSGNVGIGTSSPTEKLDVQGGNINMDNNSSITMENASDSNVHHQLLKLNTQDNIIINLSALVDGIESSTAIGINGVSETFQVRRKNEGATQTCLQVSGDTGNTTSGIDNTHSLGTASLRWTQVFATNGTINTSDRREKKNIKDIEYGLKELLKLRPVSFEWIENEDQDKKLGFIAQEVQTLIPELVVKSEERLGLYYSDIIPVTVNAVQEQQKIIENQQAEIDKLKATVSKLQDLESQIAKLRQLIEQKD